MSILVFANSVLKGYKYLTSGQVIKEAVQQAIRSNVGDGLSVYIESENPDSTMFCFVKSGENEIEYIGTAK